MGGVLVTGGTGNLGAADRFVRGGNLAPAHAVGKKTFAQFLAGPGAG
ncbi:hypothetical protein ACIA8F_28175 [Streptomyces sp. NPDC051563]